MLKTRKAPARQAIQFERLIFIIVSNKSILVYPLNYGFNCFALIIIVYKKFSFLLPWATIQYKMSTRRLPIRHTNYYVGCDQQLFSIDFERALRAEWSERQSLGVKGR